MRRISLALILVTLSLNIAAAQGRDDKKQHDLLGPVKIVEAGRIEHTIKDGKSVAGRRLPNHKITFNEAGNKTEEISYDQDGSITSRTVYAYDKAGRIQGYDTYSSVTDKSLTQPQKNAYKLDDKGNVIEYTNYQTDGTPASKFLYKYDARGNKLEELFYGWDGARTGKLVYTYDEAGRQLTQTSYNADDSISWKSVNTYNARGNRIEWQQSIAGVLRYRVTYSYDEQNRIIEQETFEYNNPPNSLRTSHAPVPGKIIYTYDDKKRTQEVATYNEDGTLKERLIYQRDERGKEVGLRMFNADGSPRDTEIYWYDQGRLLRKLSGTGSTKYEYDSKGNWIRKTLMIQPPTAPEPEVYTVEYRDIIYY